MIGYLQLFLVRYEEIWITHAMEIDDKLWVISHLKCQITKCVFGSPLKKLSVDE